MAALVINAVWFVLEAYWYVLFARLLLSFFPDISQTALGRILFRLTEPYLGAFRRFIPPLRFGGGYLDISYIVAFVAYWFVEKGVLFLLQLLFSGIGPM
ncbi:MAG: YggT family protein [Firmicutes bacterium]|nr:YggT family protein [Bacillota bacterium]